MQAVSYSIKSTYFYQFSTDFNRRLNLVRDQVPYLKSSWQAFCFQSKVSDQLLNRVESGRSDSYKIDYSRTPNTARDAKAR
jgi:hypothetical protein